ncbi:hypothetical protein SADUNF_Sadunf05G0128300 [Salix dunnii]|uniref:Filament-like plant protein n=1 Tax=Salix dunnii TaxID=1413687 RepID=A0A835MZ77_9ROSI|nr:hypothetical protein SADUNF_Sadunf05G0128300 [Salix dunnii]
MEKRMWLWKRKSSERSSGETDSSGSITSHSEKFTDDQDSSKASTTDSAQSPEVTSKTVTRDEDVNESIKSLTEKLSAALVNVSAKDDLVKQHAKVAEEAVAGWEKAENEAMALKKQIEVAIQQKSALEDRVSHLDGALKDCESKLRQAREEQEEKLHEAVVQKSLEWESIKSELENQFIELKTKEAAAKSDSSTLIVDELCQKLEYLEQENASLKLELLSQSEELELRTIERDLSTQAAETASKQHLESIKKVARLEAECRRLKAMACKSSSVNDHRTSAAPSVYVESFTDSQSDSGEKLNPVELDARKVSCSEPYKSDQIFSDSWASVLISELDQFKNEKYINRNLPASPLEFIIKRSAELEEKLQKMEQEKFVVEEKLRKMEGETLILEEKLEEFKEERDELEMALTESQDKNEASQLRLREAQKKLVELQEELSMADESKQQIESQLVSMEVEARTMWAKVNSLEGQIEKERVLSTEIAAKYQEIEDDLLRKKQEEELQQTVSSSVEQKIKQVNKQYHLHYVFIFSLTSIMQLSKLPIYSVFCPQYAYCKTCLLQDLDVAAKRHAECQKTIASLGKQLKSLATLEDFLIDTASIPEFSAGGSAISKVMESIGSETPMKHSSSMRIADESSYPSVNKNDENSPPSVSSSASSAMSLNHVSSEKKGIKLEI